MVEIADKQTDMLAVDLVNTLVPPLKKEDTIQRALDWMGQFKLSQLAVVDKGNFLGIVNEEMLYDANNPEVLIGDLNLLYSDTYVGEETHFYEVIKVAADSNIQIVAVLGETDKRFKGIITLKDTAMALARVYATQNPGATFVLQMDYFDYSLSQISRLIEENGAKVLSSFVETNPQNQQELRLTIKLNSQEISHVIATLERFGYHVIAKFEESQSEEWTKDRLDMFFKMLDI